MKGKLWNWVLSGLTAAWVGMSVLPLQAAADWQHIGCMGDLNAAKTSLRYSLSLDMSNADARLLKRQIENK